MWDVNIKRQKGDHYHEYLNFEMGRILHFKSEISNWTLAESSAQSILRFRIRNAGFVQFRNFRRYAPTSAITFSVTNASIVSPIFTSLKF